MEFFLGAFERDWERRRAALLHDLQRGGHEEPAWEWPRRAGASLLEDSQADERQPARGGFVRGPHRNSVGDAGRPMPTRFAALARGSQAAVVKLASYGGAARAGAMMNYVSRNGELPVENEKGERISGKIPLSKVPAAWDHLLDNRAPSRDVATFSVRLTGALSEAGSTEEVCRGVLRAGFAERRFVYAVERKGDDEAEIRGVLVLRDPQGERLTGDAKAASIVQSRFEESQAGNGMAARFQFHSHGNGVEFAAARIRALVQDHPGKVHDEGGRAIGTVEQAGDLVHKQWRSQLHSRRGRDVMHLLVSARAGTDVASFNAAVRDFLGEQFTSHRYIFVLHDPADDPKDVRQGGKRPHVHVHAIVTMRSETGARIETSPQVFRQWRSSMAEKARMRGIAMELTDRREFASAPSYSRAQVRPVGYSGRTEHEGTSEAAQRRYAAKRMNQWHAARTGRSARYVAQAVKTWRTISLSSGDSRVAAFAKHQIRRIERAANECQIDPGRLDLVGGSVDLRANMTALRELIGGHDTPMHTMTRPEFEAYRSRVEAMLVDVAASIQPGERKDFLAIAAAAREVIDIRREYLELSERQHAGGAYPAPEPTRGSAVHDRDAAEATRAQERSGKQTRDRDAKGSGLEPAGPATPASRAGERPVSKSAQAASTAPGATAEQGGRAKRGDRPESEGEPAPGILPAMQTRAARNVTERPNRAGEPVRGEQKTSQPDPSAQRVARLQDLQRELEQKADREGSERER